MLSERNVVRVNPTDSLLNLSCLTLTFRSFLKRTPGLADLLTFVDKS